MSNTFSQPEYRERQALLDAIDHDDVDQLSR
jgi:hypothetical protein